MSFEASYKDHLDIHLNNNKLLQPALSHGDPDPPTRHSLKSASKEAYRQQLAKARNRTLSVSVGKSDESLAELNSIAASNKQDDKEDRRYSELKPIFSRREQTAVERRNSTPQLHLSSLFPHAFRLQKEKHQHHHKSNSKDETNTNHLTSNNVINAPAAVSSDHSVDATTTKVDPPFMLKPSTARTNGSRLISSNSGERPPTPQHEDTVSSSSFILEENTSEPRSAELFIIESHTPICVSEIYREHFYDYFHTNYYGEFDHEGPFIASLRCINRKTSLGDVCEARAIIRTQYRNYNVTDLVTATNENNIFQTLFNKVNLPHIQTYGTVGDPKANEKIYLFDKTNDERFNTKIGVIYQRINQTNEYDIFSNDLPSKEMMDFLEILADRVRLKGFQKYRGDLDTKDDLHGEYSFYTIYDNHEIMFNVAPLVPSTKANGQCIERKGLVGNAFVCIVFQDPGAVFLPDFISGKVTQIYITVQPIINEEQTFYKIGIWRRNEITSIVDPPGGTYKNDASFLRYFLALLLNAVNVAIESPSLRSRVFEQRQRLKHEELKKLCHSFSFGPMPDFASEIDVVHYQTDTRPHPVSRESINSNPTPPTTDSTTTNTGRTSPVSAKRKGLSKIFGVFSSRSGSISSPTIPPNHTNSDGSPATPQSDVVFSLARQSLPSNKEVTKATRSIKTNQLPALSSRASNPQPPQNISVQPPTPASGGLSNPLVTDSLIRNNLLNTVALDIIPRSRSNSSPEDTVNTNKSIFYPVSTIDEEEINEEEIHKEKTHEEDHSMSSSNKEESKDESSEDESSEDDEF